MEQRERKKQKTGDRSQKKCLEYAKMPKVEKPADKKTNTRRKKISPKPQNLENAKKGRKVLGRNK
jgi:hypothetical protein